MLIFSCLFEGKYPVRYQIRKMRFVFTSKSQYPSSGYTATQQATGDAANPSTLISPVITCASKFHSGTTLLKKILASIKSFVWLRCFFNLRPLVLLYGKRVNSSSHFTSERLPRFNVLFQFLLTLRHLRKKAKAMKFLS